MNRPSNYTAFIATMQKSSPEENWPEALKALWHDYNNNWHAAHEIVDGPEDVTAKWIHAYLHRKEGDEWNAGYWYRRADKPYPKISLAEEFREILEFVLNQ